MRSISEARSSLSKSGLSRRVNFALHNWCFTPCKFCVCQCISYIDIKITWIKMKLSNEEPNKQRTSFCCTIYR